MSRTGLGKGLGADAGLELIPEGGLLNLHRGGGSQELVLLKHGVPQRTARNEKVPVAFHGDR